MTTSNLKPADEILTLRTRIKELQTREKELSEGIKSGDLSESGDFAVCHLVKRKTKRFDRKAAEAELGDLSRFDVEGETVALMVHELAEPVEP